MRAAAERYCLLGPAQNCRTAAERFADAGVEHLILTPLAYGDGALAQIRKLAAALGLPRTS
jgi:hypothetical protein